MIILHERIGDTFCDRAMTSSPHECAVSRHALRQWALYPEEYLQPSNFGWPGHSSDPRTPSVIASALAMTSLSTPTILEITDNIDNTLGTHGGVR